MAEKRPTSPLFRLALDYGPLLVFFIVNFAGSGPAMARVIEATVAFMIAMILAIVISWVKTRHVSPMLWISGALVLVFGGLTLYFHDDRFIKMKPTFVYAIFAGVLAFGMATGRPLLQSLLETAYPGLDAVGWRKLTRNWAAFFVVMAVLNEAVWRTQTTDFWVGFKLWGVTPMTLIFAFANIPMLMKHGLKTGGDAVGDVPPE